MAYAVQAQADLSAYYAVGEAKIESLELYRLHLLQMGLEKAAKAYLYHGEPNGQYSHRVVENARVAIVRHKVAQALGISIRELEEKYRQHLPTMVRIQSFSPSVGITGQSLTREESERQPNVEYPWQVQGQADRWIPPSEAASDFIEGIRTDWQAQQAIHFINQLVVAALNCFR